MWACRRPEQRPANRRLPCRPRRAQTLRPYPLDLRWPSNRPSHQNPAPIAEAVHQTLAEVCSIQVLAARRQPERCELAHLPGCPPAPCPRAVPRQRPGSSASLAGFRLRLSSRGPRSLPSVATCSLPTPPRGVPGKTKPGGRTHPGERGPPAANKPDDQGARRRMA
eukprot:scaffold20225_cov121-Isochrysis_galbana.AAC.2